MSSQFDTKIIENLKKRKKTSREYLRSLSPLEKIEKLVNLQEQYYQMLLIREQNGGRPIPEKWRKWHKARFESANVN
ncbi:hypothetical protein BH20ACI4_BH20ACI4_09020 [soil metagenome]